MGKYWQLIAREKEEHFYRQGHGLKLGQSLFNGA
jgi:hypothetical protein